MAAPSKNISTGYLIGLGSTLLLSFTAIFISYLSREYQLPALVLAFWRELFVIFGLAAFFALFSRRRFHLETRHRSFFILYGLTLALFNSMWTFSVELNGAAIATVLAYSSPAITAVLAHHLLKEEINSIKLVSIVFSLLGTVLVSGAADPSAWQVNAAGIVTGLLTGFFFACYNMVGKTSANKSIDPWTTMLYGFCGAIVFLFLFNVGVNLLGHAGPLANFLWLGHATGGWGILLLLSLGPTIGGYGLYLVSLGYLPATVASLIGALEPAFTVIWAYALFGEGLSGIQTIGSLMVFASVILLRWGEGRQPAVAAA